MFYSSFFLLSSPISDISTAKMNLKQNIFEKTIYCHSFVGRNPYISKVEFFCDAAIFNGIILFTLLAFFLILAVPQRFGFLITLLAIIYNSISTSLIAIQALIYQPVELTIRFGNFAGDVMLKIDGLSAWFILIINFTVLTGFFYGLGYLKNYALSKSKISLHWILFLFFHLSMLFVCMIQNGFAFLVVWEIMSLTSMMLVFFDHENPKTFKAALNYFVQMHIGVTLLTIGFIWIYHQTGSFSFDALHTYFLSNQNLWLFLLFFAGFGIKAGFIPFHSWLPHAHPAAPAHISGIMSGVIVKLGIYGILRMITFLKSDFLLLGEIVLTLSILSGLYGILNAAVHRDFKRMLAYCTIENIGIIGIGIGIGLMGIGNNAPLMYYLGFGGALLHVLNHSLFKSLLFYAAGSIYQQSHTQNMENLGGLIKSMPKTAVIFLVGALAIGGLPPFNGFVSEFLIYNGLIEGVHTNSISQIILLVLSLAGLSFIGGLSVLTFTKAFGTIFLGQPRTPLPHKPQEVSPLMLIPQYLIIGVMLSVAFLPQVYMKIIGNMLSLINPMQPDANIVNGIVKTTAGISIYSLLLTGIIAAIWMIRSLVLRNRTERIDATWGCGYVASNSRLQYTGKSFSKPMGKIFNSLLIEKKQFEELNQGEIFPVKKSYVSHYHDFFEYNFIKPITDRMIYSANYFSFVQNGRIQSYVLYGIVFILAMFILAIFNLIA
jgi:formate hydrogenlyase subunit 3/multisubunit Na+/H+ antiporter MnhD subunit